ncbi:MAG: hypothetical protein IJU01_07035 [Lachnospiraceae bacterium]|nr:hypothetical protein [Lachnospiraceae bacterium]
MNDAAAKRQKRSCEAFLAAGVRTRDARAELKSLPRYCEEEAGLKACFFFAFREFITDLSYGLSDFLSDFL